MPIWNAIFLQHELTKLLKSSGNVFDVSGGPLIWFFAFRGKDWRLYATIQETLDLIDNDNVPNGEIK